MESIIYLLEAMTGMCVLRWGTGDEKVQIVIFYIKVSVQVPFAVKYLDFFRSRSFIH